MTKEIVFFEQSNECFANLRTVMTALTCGNSEEDLNIVINRKNHVKIPLFIASALFKSVVELLESDPTARELNVNVRLINNEDEFIRKFFDSLKNMKKLSLNEESDYMNIAILGKALGNGEFHRCFDGYKEEISINNVIERIEFKKQIGNGTNSSLMKEIEFIARNFKVMINNDDFVKFYRDMKNIDIIEEILSSSKFIIDKEDSLLAFVLEIIGANQDYIHLLKYVRIEYCSPQMCENMISCLLSLFHDEKISIVLNCLKGRLTKEVVNNSVPENRYTSIEIEMDPQHGLLKKQNEENNVMMIASSTASSSSVYDLLKYNPKVDFYTKNEDNSYIEASLKNRKCIIPKGYMIRGNAFTWNQLASWKLTGKSRSANSWVTLDEHQNETFNTLELRTFKLNNDDAMTAIRLEQTSLTSTGNKYLVINAFDVFGTIVD